MRFFIGYVEGVLWLDVCCIGFFEWFGMCCWFGVYELVVVICEGMIVSNIYRVILCVIC